MLANATCRSCRFGSALVAVLPIALVSLLACSSGPPRVEPPSIDADDAGERAIEQYDLDGDALLSREELESCPGILDRMDRYDADQDGFVSATEITDRIERWQELGVALMSVGVKVTLDGKPLAGATVRLIPERFMGDSIHPASGTSDVSGVTTPSIAADQLPQDLADYRGVHIGVYEVEVSHPERELGDQRLGTEIDHTDQWNGIQLDLKTK